ncbi:hypothetical protein [Vreelandella hamiltonii]|uniref:Uncharacterized protein n=1 Tax=Vreelandella hamiltonii TaxID=502829 RepID=A0A8H9M099_9GAMM|nr:hypothetical protein [Halomonas hamiltonii]GGW23773.1 hypothetical protein GCM10007157_13950 [Halomonas hamiltonii]
MSEPTKTSTQAMITIEPNGSGGFNVYAGFNGDKPESPQMKKAGDLALLGMLAIAKALELPDAHAATKTTLH